MQFTNKSTNKSGIMTNHCMDEEQIPLLKVNRVQLWNMQIFVICINTITVRPLQKFISTFAAFLMPIFGFTFSQMGYIIAARSYGGLLSMFFPTLIYWINTKYELSFRVILFSLHMTIALLCGLFLFCHNLWFCIANRFLFGLLRTLFGIYRGVLGAAYSTKSGRMWIYSLFYTATPLSLPLLMLFGVLLQTYSFDVALLLIFAPCFITGFGLLYYLPADSITDGINMSFGNIGDNLPYNKNCFKILFDLNRILKCFIRFLNGIYIQMFTVCISAWMEDSYNITAAKYYTVIVAIFIAEIVGTLTTLSKIHQKYECLKNGSILYAISVFIGIIVNFIIFITESINHFSIPFWVALLLISLIYYAGTLMYIAGKTLTVILVNNNNMKRSQYIAYNTVFFAAGILFGSLLGTSTYQRGGIWLVTKIGFYVSFCSFILCCILGYRVFKKESPTSLPSMSLTDRSVISS